MGERPGWWMTFGKMLAVVAAWYLVPVGYIVIRVGAIFWGLAHEPPREHCVDTCGGGLAVFAALAALLMVAISVVIGLIVTAVAACFRPRRAFLYGNLVAVIAFAVNVLLLFSGLYR